MLQKTKHTRTKGVAKWVQTFRVMLRYFISNRWESIARVKDISLPILFLSGEKDELIPPRHMKVS